MFRKANTPTPLTANYILGVNVDSERTLLVYGNSSGLVSERLEFPSPSKESFPVFLSEVSSNADRLLMITQAQRLPLPDVVSVSVAGNYDAQTGVVSSSLEFTQWKSESLRSQLGLRFNLPVYAENKANAGMLAELLFGTHPDIENAIYLTFTPRVRISLISGGRLYHNPGATAGSLGKLSLAPSLALDEHLKTLNDIASGSGLLRHALHRHPTHWDSDLRLPDFLRSALDQDPYSLEVITEAATWLGRSMESLVHILRPEMIIVGHPYHLLGDLWLKPMTEALSLATGLGGGQLPQISASPLGNRQPELEALAPAIMELRNARNR